MYDIGMGPMCIYIVLSDICCWISAILEIGFFIFETFKFVPTFMAFFGLKASDGDSESAQLAANVRFINNKNRNFTDVMFKPSLLLSILSFPFVSFLNFLYISPLSLILDGSIQFLHCHRTYHWAGHIKKQKYQVSRK